MPSHFWVIHVSPNVCTIAHAQCTPQLVVIRQCYDILRRHSELFLSWGGMLCFSYECEDFLFIMRSRSKLLFVKYILPKSFVRETIKVFFVFVLPCKKCLFSWFVQQKKSSCSCCFAKPKIFVFVFVKNCKQQNLRVRSSGQTKNLCKRQKSSCLEFSRIVKIMKRKRNKQLKLYKPISVM